MLPLSPCHPWLRQGMSLKRRPAAAVVPVESADGPVLARRQERTTSGRRAAAPAKQARPRYGPPSTCEVPPICLALTSCRPAPSPGTGQHHNRAGASDSACHGADGEAPGRSPAESYFRAPQVSRVIRRNTNRRHMIGSSSRAERRASNSAGQSRGCDSRHATTQRRTGLQPGVVRLSRQVASGTRAAGSEGWVAWER